MKVDLPRVGCPEPARPEFVERVEGLSLIYIGPCNPQTQQVGTDPETGERILVPLPDLEIAVRQAERLADEFATE